MRGASCIVWDNADPGSSIRAPQTFIGTASAHSQGLEAPAPTPFFFFFFKSCCRATQRPGFLSCLGPPLKAIWACGSDLNIRVDCLWGARPCCLDRRGLPHCSSQDAMSRWPDGSDSWDILGTLFMCVQGEGSALLLGMWLQGATVAHA